MTQDAWRGDNGPLWRGYECEGCRFVDDCLLPHQECRRRQRMASIVEAHDALITERQQTA